MLWSSRRSWRSTTGRPGSCSSAPTGRSDSRSRPRICSACSAASRRGCSSGRRCCCSPSPACRAAWLRARVPPAGGCRARRSTPTSSRAGGTGSSAAATAIADSSISARTRLSASPAFFEWSAQVPAVGRGLVATLVVLPSRCRSFQMLQVLERRPADQRLDVGAVPRALPPAAMTMQPRPADRACLLAVIAALAYLRDPDVADRRRVGLRGPGRRAETARASLDRRACVVLRAIRRRDDAAPSRDVGPTSGPPPIVTISSTTRARPGAADRRAALAALTIALPTGGSRRVRRIDIRTSGRSRESAGSSSEKWRYGEAPSALDGVALGSRRS